MSGLHQLERLHKWSLDELRRLASEIDRMVDDLRKEISSLDRRVLQEIEAARGKIDLERVLPAYRKMMRGQRSRLERSVDEMLQERDRVQSQIEAKFSELKSTAQVIANRAERERQSRQRKDLAIADEIGRQQHRGR